MVWKRREDALGAPDTTAGIIQAEWGRRITEARGDRPQSWLAEQAHTNQVTISRIERGVCAISPTQMVYIAAALGKDLNELFRFPAGISSRAQWELEAKRGKAS